MPKGIRGFQKGNPGKQKGTLNKETLTKIERRAYFEKRAAEKFDKWIDECRPEYGLDQFIGKANDIIDFNAKIETIADPEARKIMKDILHEVLRKYNS